MDKVVLLKCPVCNVVLEISQFSFDYHGELVLNCFNCKNFVKVYLRYGILGYGRDELDKASIAFEKAVIAHVVSKDFRDFCDFISISKMYEGGNHA
ncbi:MAG TPA: hypothetical protein VMR41_02340 [Patescibacteria group bacterium]|nr:hypothetical protein [Patescibacteria group bacterium]